MTRTTLLLPTLFLSALILSACSGADDAHSGHDMGEVTDKAVTNHADRDHADTNHADRNHADMDHSGAEHAHTLTDTPVLATGRVMSISPEVNFITLDHDPIPEINMGAMRMPFDVAPDIDLTTLSENDAIRFRLTANDQIGLLITAICVPARDGADCLEP